MAPIARLILMMRALKLSEGRRPTVKKLLFGDLTIRQWCNSQYMKVISRQWWIRMAKFASVPTMFYLYGLDRDPYDGKYKYYMLGPKTEWYIGQQLFQIGMVDSGSPKFLKNGQMEVLLNDILQHLLIKNDIPNREDWHVHVADD